MAACGERTATRTKIARRAKTSDSKHIKSTSLRAALPPQSVHSEGSERAATGGNKQRVAARHWELYDSKRKGAGSGNERLGSDGVGLTGPHVATEVAAAAGGGYRAVSRAKAPLTVGAALFRCLRVHGTLDVDLPSCEARKRWRWQ